MRIRERKVTEKRLLRRRILENGTAIENYSMTVIGEKWEENTDNSISVRLKVGFLYEKMSSPSGSAYKITNYYHKATRLDSSFRLYSTYETASESGAGFDYVGDLILNLVNQDAYFYKSFPVSGVTYSEASNFYQYVINQPASGGGCSCTLTFQRITSGTFYNFTVSVPIADS